MKSILTTISALVIMVSVASAQMKQDSSKKMNSKMNSSATTKEFVTMKNGKVMESNDGKWTTLTATFTCTDGSKVSTDGTLTKKNGTTTKLTEGDKVYKSGHMTMAKSSATPKPAGK